MAGWTWLVAVLLPLAARGQTPSNATGRVVRCTPCEAAGRRPELSNYLADYSMDPDYRGNGADNLGYDWSPKAWGGPANPKKTSGGEDGQRGGRQMPGWKDRDPPCVRCGPSWEQTRQQDERRGDETTVTSTPLSFRAGHHMADGMRWDGFSNGVSWITRGVPWDRPRPDGFRPWDNTAKGASGWDQSGKGYYFAGGKDAGYASSWQYGSNNDMKWNYGSKPWDQGGGGDGYGQPPKYGQGGSMFGGQYPSKPDSGYLPNDRPPQGGYRPWPANDRYDQRPSWNREPTQRPPQHYLPQDKYRPSYGSNSIWNGRPDSQFGASYPQDTRPSYSPSRPYPQERPSGYPQPTRPPSYPVTNRPSTGYYPQEKPARPYPQDSRPSGYPHDSRPSGYPQDSRPSGYPQDSRPSGYPQDSRPSGYPQDSRPSGYPQDSRPSRYPQDSRPSGYPQDSRPSGYPQDSRPSGYPQDTRPSGYPQDHRPAGYPQDNRPPPKGYYTGFITEISNEEHYGIGNNQYGGNKYPSDNRYPGGDQNRYPDRDRYPSDGNKYPSDGNRYPDRDRYPSDGNRYPDKDRYPDRDRFPSDGNRYPDKDRYPQGDRYPSSGDYDRGPEGGAGDGGSWNYGQDNKDGVYRRTGGSYPPYRGGNITPARISLQRRRLQEQASTHSPSPKQTTRHRRQTTQNDPSEQSQAL